MDSLFKVLRAKPNSSEQFISSQTRELYSNGHLKSLRHHRISFSFGHFHYDTKLGTHTLDSHMRGRISQIIHGIKVKYSN